MSKVQDKVWELICEGKFKSLGKKLDTNNGTYKPFEVYLSHGNIGSSHSEMSEKDWQDLESINLIAKANHAPQNCLIIGREIVARLFLMKSPEGVDVSETLERDFKRENLSTEMKRRRLKYALHLLCTPHQFPLPAIMCNGSNGYRVYTDAGSAASTSLLDVLQQINQLYTREWARVIWGAPDQHCKTVICPHFVLRGFFTKFPGLRLLVGGIMLTYYNSRAAEALLKPQTEEDPDAKNETGCHIM